MELPDVIGFVLDEALNVIQNCGYEVKEIISLKSPYKPAGPIGIARVVRLSPTGNGGLQVIITYQDYRKEV
ncbi:hypothetical protein [Phosphitispora sp. TUW77]|uniref:hypothetical protein n=1 Tax=Phosphitispora sp. TUW77 TaxID=3152361 RepID=UPI003AB5F6B2